MTSPAAVNNGAGTGESIYLGEEGRQRRSEQIGAGRPDPDRRRRREVGADEDGS